MSKYIPIIPIRDLTEVTFCEINDYDKSLYVDVYNLVTIIGKLKRASKRGNNEKTKYNITFVTNNGLMKVNTTIWMVGDEYVLLKENLYMPITSIIDVI